jgi:hypothetical protein
LALGALLVLAACQPPDEGASGDNGDADVPSGCTAVDVASSPEKVELLTQLAQTFNDTDAAKEGGWRARPRCPRAGRTPKPRARDQ